MPDKIQGTIDLPLSPPGRTHAKGLALALNSLGKFDYILSSPARRAKDTARIIAGNSNYFTIQALGPWNRGGLQGMTEEQAKATTKQMVYDGDITPAGGESFNQLKNRVLPYMRSLISAMERVYPNYAFAVITHSTNISLICGWVKAGANGEVKLDEMFETIEPGEVYWLHKERGVWKVKEDIEPAKLERLDPGIWLITHTETKMNA